ncbi:hypothetical protein FGIG_09869 [Fasciola gigantica]|uniref:Uncharacterized protein n=1 Tax=Fasciola gigantica TaxID=46835 RepID=A0A504YIJ6_FASGI|nr:hypothetical protein FGIG_09869 [Fasciola gigantica]
MVYEAQQKWLKKTRANDENSQSILAAERCLSESKDSSCWHWLCPFLGLLLLLLLPLLLLACLFLIPECESQYLWTRCAENSIIWRYFYNPLRLVRGERRPPL